MTALSRILSTLLIEIRLAARNRWVLLSTLTLTAFALALVFLGSAPAGAVKTDSLTVSAVGLATLTVYLVPLMALLIAYDAFAGEIERGTLALMLATPLGRGELMAAKFLGALTVLSLAVLIGFSVAGATVVAQHGWTEAGLAAWGWLIATALLLGAVFLAVGLALSAAVRQTGTAAALAVGCWLLLVVLYDLALLGGIVVDGGGLFTKVIFPYLVLANPGDAFRLYNLAMIDAGVPISGLDGLARTLPYPPQAALAALAGWLVVMLAAAAALVRRLAP